jgi:hypothetical protein
VNTLVQKRERIARSPPEHSPAGFDQRGPDGCHHAEWAIVVRRYRAP